MNKIRLVINNDSKKRDLEKFFIKNELQSILNLYAKMVSNGSWKDYSFTAGIKEVSFNVYQRASDKPVLRMLKNRKPQYLNERDIIKDKNGNILKKSNKIIANPNCSTIQMVVALNDIYKKFGLKRLVISTYQSVSGTGQAAVKQMMDERQGLQPERVYPYQIDQNCFPHGGDFLENGYTTEELKLINETCKIFNDSSIKITATVVRIPVIGGHSESINIETHKPFQIEEIKKTFSETAGVKVQDNPSKFDYPMPITAHKKNDVFVGRIRKDETVENGLNIWIVADNLRKGAATNAVQIADYIFKKNLSKV